VSRHRRDSVGVEVKLQGRCLHRRLALHLPGVSRYSQGSFAGIFWTRSRP